MKKSQEKLSLEQLSETVGISSRLSARCLLS